MIVDDIGVLVTNDPEAGEGPYGLLRDAAVVSDGDRIAWVGPASQVPDGTDGERLDASGRCVVPGFVDAHTHLVFAGDRSAEYAARVAGEPYQAGGILETVAATRAASNAELLANARRLANEALRSGTTTIEVKSGYGLTVDDERRILEVARDLPTVHRTFLGAHVVGPEHADDPDSYVDLVRTQMLDACAPLATAADVFCERGAFDADQSRAVLEAARQRGLALRVHANQLGHGAGARLAAELAAASADHLTYLDDDDVDVLAGAGVVATLLPGAEFSTGSPPAPARRLLDAGVTVALASDCNPGTSYTTSMPLMIALACRNYRLAPLEALHAATVGGARALRADDVGRLRPGDRADLVILDARDPAYLAYRPGVALIDSVVQAGAVVYSAT